MTLPNFLVLGGAKCGTTSIHFYLLDHPDVFLCPKEIHYFYYDGGNPGGIRATTLDAYEKLFRGATREKAIGEVAIRYLTKQRAVDNIKNTIPNAKMITSLRNPVDRAYSHFLMHCRGGTARTKSGRLLNSHPRPEDVEEYFRRPETIYEVDCSLYYKHLSRYYEAFPREQLHVCFLEEIMENGNRVMKDIFEFLGVSSEFVPDTGVRYNVTASERPKRLLRSIRRWKPLSRVAVKLIPSWMLNAVHRRRKRMSGSSAGSSTDGQMPDGVRRDLAEFFEDDMRSLEGLIDKDLSRWYGSTG